MSRENRDTPAPAKTISLSFRGGHLTKTSGKRCPRCAPSRARANAYPPDPLRCVVRTVCFRALHLVGAEFTRSIAPTTRVFDRGHNPAFPSFRANPLQVCFCGPRNAVRMAVGNRASASRSRAQSIRIESGLTNTHLNLTETWKRTVEEPDAR